VWLHLGGNAHIHHGDSRTDMPRQHVDRRAAGQEIVHHLWRDLLRVCAHPFSHHAVIAGHGDDDLVRDARAWIAGDAGYLDGQRLQPAETTLRLSQHILPRARRLHRFLVQRTNFVK